LFRRKKTTLKLSIVLTLSFFKFYLALMKIDSKKKPIVGVAPISPGATAIFQVEGDRFRYHFDLERNTVAQIKAYARKLKKLKYKGRFKAWNNSDRDLGDWINL